LAALDVRIHEVNVRRVRVKPSKGMSLLTVVGGILMLVFVVGRGLPMSDGFGVVWIFFLLAIIAYHAFNAFSDRGAATQEIDVEGFEPKPLAGGNAADRLEHLESLRAKNLITEEEYRKKRAEIIEQL
jgi:uncharacterized YccA/Bax inhibitor family protein